MFYSGHYSSSDLGTSPDFVKLAQAYGAVGLRAEKPSDVLPVLQEALKARLPVLMDFVIDRYEDVYPIVPPGAAINEMLFGDEKKKEEKKLRAVK